MTEKAWAKRLAALIQNRCLPRRGRYRVSTQQRLPYSYQVTSYKQADQREDHLSYYETDILITQQLDGERWIPRVVIETKLTRLHSHDAITYSKKASMHKQVHPYLRYGMVVGARGRSGLPGRLVRHGEYFDFMFAFSGHRPTPSQAARFSRLIRTELRASQRLEQVIYDSRRVERAKYQLVHRRLMIE